MGACGARTQWSTHVSVRSHLSFWVPHKQLSKEAALPDKLPEKLSPTDTFPHLGHPPATGYILSQEERF